MDMRFSIFFITLLFLFGFSRCNQNSAELVNQSINSSKWINQSNKNLTDIIVTDVFSPPQTSRIYAYTNLASYEASRPNDIVFNSLSERLNGFESIPKNKYKIDPTVAGITAFTYVGKNLVYDSVAFINTQDAIFNKLYNIVSNNNLFKASQEYGELIGKIILKRSQSDGYLERTAYSGFIVDENDLGKWEPTPPAYIDALEPHWSKLLPFAIDSSNQFKPSENTIFSINKNSTFYKEAVQVYNKVNNLTDEQKQIAMFWDCNPNQSNNFGHLMYNDQQISPAGHWIHITCQVAEQKKLSNTEASYVLAKVGITLADSFIISWDEKYRSNLIRPETYINKYIDAEWKPILETPPFPEHTSAHSVASRGASLILTNLFGDNFAFIDSTEIPFGLPVRKYKSFKQASDEAAISRLLGGIHYKPAVEAGKKQGEDLGNFIINKLDDGINFKTANSIISELN